MYQFMYQSILQFWFEEITPAQWWKADSDFDALVAKRFGAIHQQAVCAELFGWREEPQGRLAEVIVLDQFSRNIFRNTRRAFEADPLALALAQESVACGADKALSETERVFLYMPYMHSESKLIHTVADRLFLEHAPKSNHEFELRHKAIIDRFGRYPHRNAVLGRESAADEVTFLLEPGSRF
jgi:uncharacterized protein (DUF924 family)